MSVVLARRSALARRLVLPSCPRRNEDGFCRSVDQVDRRYPASSDEDQIDKRETAGARQRDRAYLGWYSFPARAGVSQAKADGGDRDTDGLRQPEVRLRPGYGLERAPVQQGPQARADVEGRLKRGHAPSAHAGVIPRPHR